MRLADALLGVGAVCLFGFACAWMAIGAWPREWVEWRANWGDRLAIEEMWKRTMREGNGRIYGYWAKKKGEITERDVVFMEPESRKTMKIYFEALGKKTPLLDIMIDNE